MKNQSEKIGILIPCYNTGESVRHVLESFSDEVLNRITEIVAIDNKSTDRTWEILEHIRDGNAPVSRILKLIRNSKNEGLGGSQKIAFDYFRIHKFTHFMIIHGDGQGNGDLIARSFLEELDRAPELDLITASRFLQNSNISDYNFLRKIGNHTFNLLTYALTGARMSDSGAGIIMLRTQILDKITFHKFSSSFQFNPELNIRLYRIKGLKRLEIPLAWRDSEAGSNINAYRYCWDLLKILLRFGMQNRFRLTKQSDH